MPYERRFQGIIYGSAGRAYADSTAIVTGSFYPSGSFLVKTDVIGYTTSTRSPSIAGHYNILQSSGFTTSGEPLTFHTDQRTGFQRRAAALTKWNTDLDTLWAYSYRDTAFDTSDPYSWGIDIAEEGFLLGLSLTDTAVFRAGRAVAHVDTSGDVQWAMEHAPTLELSNVVRANDGGFLCTARDAGHSIVFKTNASFGVQWCQEILAPYTMRGEEVTQGLDDVVHYLVGIQDTVEVINSTSATYSRSMAWLDLDPTTGALLNAREIDFRWPTAPTHLMRTSDGHFLAAGTYTNNTRIANILRRWEAYIFKLNSAGEMVWADTLDLPGFRSRVMSMDEHEDRLLLQTQRYDHLNPFHQYYLLDTDGTPICGLESGAFRSLGALTITASAYAPPVFTPTELERRPITWSIGTSAMPTIQVCGGLTTEVVTQRRKSCPSSIRTLPTTPFTSIRRCRSNVSAAPMPWRVHSR